MGQAGVGTGVARAVAVRLAAPGPLGEPSRLGVAVAFEIPDGEISHPASSAPQRSAQSIEHHLAQNESFLETIFTSSLQVPTVPPHPRPTTHPRPTLAVGLGWVVGLAWAPGGM